MYHINVTCSFHTVLGLRSNHDNMLSTALGIKKTTELIKFLSLWSFYSGRARRRVVRMGHTAFSHSSVGGIGLPLQTQDTCVSPCAQELCPEFANVSRARYSTFFRLVSRKLSQQLTSAILESSYKYCGNKL